MTRKKKIEFLFFVDCYLHSTNNRHINMGKGSKAVCKKLYSMKSDDYKNKELNRLWIQAYEDGYRFNFKCDYKRKQFENPNKTISKKDLLKKFKL